MSSRILESYEQIPYGSQPITQSHPDCLATEGVLRGMTPAPVDRCRVLELGCASGGNLIPMAASHPKSVFLGVDLSPRQIAAGRTIVDALGIHNIELRGISLMEVDASWGEFDYILCHGVFSWVPQLVRDRILEICRNNLAPQGLAYISFNTYPGWRQKMVLRDLMRFHSRRSEDPAERLRQARGILAFAAEAVETFSSPSAGNLREANERMRGERDSYVFHEFLEASNEPLYFEEFATLLGEHAPQFVAEAGPTDLELQQLAPGALSKLADFARSPIEREQYLDFLRNRTFRRSVVCRADVSLTSEDGAEALLSRPTFLASPLRPVSVELDATDLRDETFIGPGDVEITTNQPLLKSALEFPSARYPRSVPFDAVWQAVEKRCEQRAHSVPGGEGRRFLADCLLHCNRTHFLNLVELHCSPSRFTLDPGAQPSAWPVARFHARHGSRVPSLNHKLAELSEFQRRVLPLLDGTRSLEDLVEQLLPAAGGAASPEAKRASVRRQLDSCLTSLAHMALLWD